MALIFTVPLGSLVILQTKNLSQNKTTYERYSKSKAKEEVTGSERLKIESAEE